MCEFLEFYGFQYALSVLLPEANVVCTVLIVMFPIFFFFLQLFLAANKINRDFHQKEIKHR